MKLTSKEILKYLFTGSYLLKQSESYLSRLIRKGWAYRFEKLNSNDNCDKELENRIKNGLSRIIAFEMRSMHKASREKKNGLLKKLTKFLLSIHQF